MILHDIGDYLAERRCASITDLEYRFETDADALRGMLAVWERRGCVRRLDAGTRCRGCTTCGEVPEAYEWIGAPPRRN